VLLSHVQLYGFQARLRSFGEAKKLNNGGQTLQANATLATSYPRRRSTRITSACQKRYTPPATVQWWRSRCCVRLGCAQLRPHAMAHSRPESM